MPGKFLHCSVLSALCLFFLVSQSASAQQFIAPVAVKTNSAAFPAEDFRGALAFVDFNGDGRKDILGIYTPKTPKPGSGQYAVLFGNADGSYTPELTGIASTPDPSGGGHPLKVADVDGDGRPDLVIVTSSPPNDHGDPTGPAMLTVYLNNGNGTFRAVAPVVAASDFAALDLVTDLNKDGKPDLIIDDYSAGSGDSHFYTVWINQGAGQFKSAFKVPTSGHGPVTTYADFNGDGYPDVVVYTDLGSQIFLNNKGTSFNAGLLLPISALLAVSGDLNHDGKPDLVGIDFTYPIPARGHILLGNGDGTFRIGQTFNFSVAPYSFNGNFLVDARSVSIADVNGDGLPDIAVDISTHLLVFPGTGTGTVGAPSVFNTGFQTSSIVDVNNDGKPELLLTSLGYSIAGNDGKGGFLAPRETPVFVPNSIITADFNKDGKGDIAVVSDASTTAGTGTVVVFPGSGRGWLNAGKSYKIGMPSGAVAAGDVNGDGKLDLVVARSASYISTYRHPNGNSTDLSVLLGNGDGTFQPARNFTVLGAPASGDTDNFATLADVNHDGKLDLVGDWGVALGKGDGTFASPISLPSSIKNVIAMALGDFNGNGVPGIVVGTSIFNVQNPPAFVYTLIGDGKGSYAIKTQQQVSNNGFINALALADMNGDGKLDLIFDSSQFTATTSTRNLTVRLGDGKGAFGSPINRALDRSISDTQLLISDFNRDGKQDVLFLGGRLTLLLGIGGGKLSATPQLYPTELDQGVVVDLNSDGAPDVAGTTPTGVTRLLNTRSRATVTK